MKAEKWKKQRSIHRKKKSRSLVWISCRLYVYSSSACPSLVITHHHHSLQSCVRDYILVFFFFAFPESQQKRWFVSVCVSNPNSFNLPAYGFATIVLNIALKTIHFHRRKITIQTLYSSQVKALWLRFPTTPTSNTHSFTRLAPFDSPFRMQRGACKWTAECKCKQKRNGAVKKKPTKCKQSVRRCTKPNISFVLKSNTNWWKNAFKMWTQ